MPESALIGAIAAADGFFDARYLRWSGRPYAVVADLRTIWHTFHRDTAATVRVLLAADWFSLCPSCGHIPSATGTVAVPGVGHTLRDPSPLTHGRIDTAEPGGCLTWMFLFDQANEQIVVYKASIIDGRWRPCGRYPLDPDRAQAVLSCGGNAEDGHRWVPARVALEVPDQFADDGFPGIAYDADVCAAAHPDGWVVARFEDHVAEQIAADTAAGRWGTRWPHLSRDGHHFDLLWHRGQPARLRVARDSSNRRLIGAYHLPWRRLPTPPAFTGRYHPGDRVELVHTDDPHTRLRPRDQGTVKHHDIGHNGVDIVWDHGPRLAMLLDDGDQIRLIRTAPQGDAR